MRSVAAHNVGVAIAVVEVLVVFVVKASVVSEVLFSGAKVNKVTEAETQATTILAAAATLVCQTSSPSSSGKQQQQQQQQQRSRRR